MPYQSWLRLVTAATGLVLGAGVTGAAETGPRRGSVEEVTQVTGSDPGHDTASGWNVHGADLGHMFLHRGDLYLVFGDTFGADGADWRSNTLARVSSPDPRHGLQIVAMHGEPGEATEVLGSRKVDGDEKTVIPTAGISIDGRMYLHSMSVRRWSGPGRWDLNHAGWAYSDDDGRTWTQPPEARWPGDTAFGQVALVADGGWVYVFGIPAGRFGGARLARVAEDDLLALDAYRYWDGVGWTPDAGAAATVVPAPVGELSVRWSADHGRWLMMYLNEERAAIVLRTAAWITGPWSEERTIVTAERYPQLYAPYLVPRPAGGPGDGPEIYFTMSRFDVYQVFLMRARL